MLTKITTSAVSVQDDYLWLDDGEAAGVKAWAGDSVLEQPYPAHLALGGTTFGRGVGMCLEAGLERTRHYSWLEQLCR